MSDSAKELAAWAAYARRAIGALPPVDDDVQRAVDRMLPQSESATRTRKLIKRKAVTP